MKRSSRLTGLLLALMGALLLLNNLDKPSVKALRGVDIVKLVASGGLLGIGFMCLMGRLSDRKD